ncbi:hypothetical protein BDQ12DRAFT_710469 [Crucibulum laeve]|uniref:Uncharacterized protein n=1 Tax=Crucibulum laeve TaxID=68775 RepID=A0A5C3MCQ1_9AGAR|nr:hypothetical protein BDQ12DRAFT_710469 [Crucibulum laeve]
MTSFDISTIQSVDLDKLLISARNAFQILEPWFQAKPLDSERVGVEAQEIISGIQLHGRAFFNAIDLSITTSKRGVIFATDAEWFFQFIRRGIEDSESAKHNVLKFVDDLRSIAVTAEQSAKKMLDEFRSVRRGIFELTKNIPVVMEHVLIKLNAADSSRRRRQRGADTAHMMARLAHELGTVFSAQAMAPIPILGIIIPIALPLFEFIAGKVREGQLQKIRDRDQQIISYHGVCTQLERAYTEMETLLQHVSSFANWWTDMDTQLLSIKQRIDEHGSSALNPRELTHLQSHWQTVAKRYNDYILEISKLRDFYPMDHDEMVEEQAFPCITFTERVCTLTDAIDTARASLPVIDSARSIIKIKYCEELNRKMGIITENLKNELLTLLHMLQIVGYVKKASSDCVPLQPTHKEEAQNTSRELIERHMEMSKAFSTNVNAITNIIKMKRPSKKMKHVQTLQKTVRRHFVDDGIECGLRKTLALLCPDGLSALESLGASIDEIGVFCVEICFSDLSYLEWGNQPSMLKKMRCPWTIEADALNNAVDSVSRTLELLDM